ncbi:MAG: alpha/beta hydrolase [Roseovarius sp.]|jgi:pimeloyl-ACP methyl ester carboxylesterase|nr:alpha/beta hydrolase [Roseovarius sp.]
MVLSAGGTAYDLSGPEGAPVVALIHGLGLTRASTWGAIAPILSQQFRVLTYDLCGHGQSALPGNGSSLTVLSEQLIALMDELAIGQAALIGFSLGGMINRRCAMDHASRVSSLVVLNSPHERAPALQQQVEAAARDAGAGGPEATIDAALARWFTEDFRAAHADVVAEIRRVVLANEPGNYARHRRVLAEGVTELIRPQVAIPHPTLVMTSQFDSGSTPAMAQTIAHEIAGAETIVVPGLKHLGLIERPEMFTAPIIAFLTACNT